MPTLEERKILTEEEKLSLLQKNTTCYICQQALEGYDRNEIQFDHIYSYADGYPQDLNNFAPIHASSNPNKTNCHKSKGRKKPVDYREEIRIKDKLSNIEGLKDICKNAIESNYKISENFDSILFNSETLSLYNQNINGENNYYFFHEIDIKFIENDDEIQLRPLEPKIIPLIFNLKQAVQLFPSLGRLDKNSKKVKIFDGQHKAVAQIIGNNKTKIQCIVFVEPNIAKLREVIYQAHTDLVQQKYKKSHIDAKLADIYKQKIDDFRKRVNNPDAPYSEFDIMTGESKANITKFLLSSIIDEIKSERSFVREYVAQDKNEQKTKPVLWQSLERLISVFCNLQPVPFPSNDNHNYRSEEIENICFIIDQLEEYSIKSKWNPNNSDSLHHVLARTYFYRTAFNTWIEILEKALRFSFEIMNNKAIEGALCYREPFDSNVKHRFITVIKKLFDAPLWVVPEIQKNIASANKDSVISDIFKQQGLDHIYLTKVS